MSEITNTKSNKAILKLAKTKLKTIMIMKTAKEVFDKELSGEPLEESVIIEVIGNVMTEFFDKGYDIGFADGYKDGQKD